jgi:hypothetical protein
MANQRLNIDIVAKDKSKQALNNVQTSLERVKRSVFNLRNAFIGLGAGLVIKGFVNAGIQIENLEVQLNALFGSAKEGKKALKEVTDFASGTPFELKNIQQGITALATVRKTAEESGVSFEELLKITGNTATILGGDFALASLQIQRSFSAGISSAELFKERGVKAMAGFKEGVRVNTKESIQGLKRAFGTGGEFGNLIDDLSRTLFGTISNLKDAFFIFQVEVAQGFFGALKDNLGDLKKTVELNRKEIAEFGSMIGAGLSSAIQVTASTLKFLKDNLELIITSLKILIAFKLIKFFYNLATAIGVATVAMRRFNMATKANIIIGGASLLLSQLDKIVSKLREIGLLENERKFPKIPGGKIHEGMTITKKIPESTFMDKIILQGKIFKQVITDVNSTALEEMKNKFSSVGEIIARNINEGIKKVSRSIAESIILGKDLAETFRKMAEQILVNILAHFIELTARMLIDIALQKTKLNTMKAQESSLKRQIALQSTLMALGGGFGGFFGGFFAKGGAVSKGQPIVVGENGPEMFVPNSTGQITQSARGTGNGGAVNVNFNITTVDAKGFDELLVARRGTISRIINESVNERGREAII